MTTESAPTITSDERALAAVSHFFGMVVALIIWVLQKDKSRFVRFQALQALTFDLSAMVVGMLLGTCTFVLMFASTAGGIFMSAIASSSSNSFLPVLLTSLLPFGMFACIFPLALLFMGSRIWAAISVFNGRDFHYPILGKRVEAFLARG